uniref:Ig-like domain-containing protein n=1 Tax=Cyprinus carpio TaxID=7962 RepID=A0A8C1RZZ0_CYPCA
VGSVMTADQIRPNQEISVIKEDATVTLSCSYDTTSSYVYWYRQYPNGELRYLIYKASWSSVGGGRPADPRFQSTTSKTSTELTITGVTLSDSALYYCALEPSDTKSM